MELVILAAGKGSRIFKSINRNKCLIKIHKQTLIEKIINDAISLKLFKKINVVTGYRKNKIIEKIKNYKENYIFNKDFNKKEMLHSLKLGIKNCKNDTLVTYSDIIFSKRVFQDINLNKKTNYILPVLRNWKKVWKIRKKEIIDDCESLNFDALIVLVQLYLHLRLTCQLYYLNALSSFYFSIPSNNNRAFFLVKSNEAFLLLI